MPCDTSSRSQRRYYDRITQVQHTLESVTSNGNISPTGIDVFGSIKTDGYFLGDATFISNITYSTFIQNATLNDVVLNGNTSIIGAYFGGDLGASGYFIGDGSQLQNLPTQTTPTLQQVTSNGSITNQKVNFTNDVTSFQTSSNIIIGGNVTCTNLIGSGEFLDGVSNMHEISELDSRVTSFESNVMITNTSALTDVQTGDILISTNNGVLDKLAIGSNEQLLYSNTNTSQPEWINTTDIYDLENRTSELESNILFTSTPNLNSLNTGDILLGYGTSDIRNLAPETTADNTYLTTGDYGTGYGRLLRMDERGENAMWLHPTSNLDYEYNSGSQFIMSYVPIFDDELNNGLYLRIRNRLSNETATFTGRIRIRSNYFDIKFGQGMFYSQAGVKYTDTNGNDGTSSTWHPGDIKYNWYTQGTIVIKGDYNGDGSKLFFGTPAIPNSTTTNPSTGLSTFGKDGQLLAYSNGYFLGYSDRRVKSNIHKLTNALDKLAKLAPKLYDKDGKRGSGLIAQEVYYDAKELRHIVWPGRDSSPNEEAPESDYSDWGKRPACIRYPHLVAYVVKSIQELRERIETLKNNRT